MQKKEKSIRNTNFSDWVRSHQKALQRYCCALTGSSWEGEDLAQETWLKVWSAVHRSSNIEGGMQLARSYLYRTARNSWIDRSRKKTTSMTEEPIDDMHIPQQQSDYVAIWTAMETLVNGLGPNQRIALLLVDILKYTAAESAELLNTTEGAVKGALHRARSKLRKLADNRSGFLGDSDDRIIQESHVGWPIGNDVVYAYLDALRQQNTAALIMLMNDASPLELAPVLCNQITHTNRLQEKKIATKPIESRLVHMVMAA
ncbi:ECF RNA polymerase sigma factor SigG [compost metagenome]